ncbi:MAG: hypothetical protein ACOZAQ_08295 [Pseudomonadota bacterium]
MLKLDSSLAALNAPDFPLILLDELNRQDALSRPLQQGLTYGSVALLDKVKLGVLERREDERAVRIRIAAYYASLITGCNCIDDPSPLSELPEYAELSVEIDRVSGAASVALAKD